MLISLSIKNYALIDNLQVKFGDGLTIITGETGAGKSILLGGLGLVLGKRADLNSLKNKEEKCIVETEFSINNYNLEGFFKENDLDFEKNTLIRREILPSGKSRAFINDTPVNLDVLSSLGERLIDIHSQYQTLQLTGNDFQFQVIDAVAGNADILSEYQEKLREYLKTKSALKKLIDFQQEADKEQDYNSFLLKELQQANLTEGMLSELEATYEKLNNIEEINERISHSQQLLGEDQIGVISSLNELKSIFQKLAGYGQQYENLSVRVQSTFIEVDDIYTEIQQLGENLEADPKLLEEVNNKLQTIYNLQKKHNALDVAELISIKSDLEEKVAITENLESDIKEKQLQVFKFEEELDSIAQKIHDKRESVIPTLTQYLENLLGELGMPNAKFKIEVIFSDLYHPNGKDELSFLFSANKGTAFGEIKKVASGGELSRIMLCIKSLLAQHMNLPTIMFDEIDTGVSGEISNKMGDIMLEMSKTMQVFSITHLPQIASKGHSHYKVFKEDVNDVTQTNLRKLNHDERIVEIAQMLGGLEMSSSAIAHAKELLN